MDKMNAVQLQLINIIANMLFGVPLQEEEHDWGKLRQEALDQTVFPLVYSAIKKQLPEDEKVIWQRLNDKIIAQNMTIFYEHGELHSAMEEIECPYVTLKGCGSAYYYPDPVKRMMGDVDFLVDPIDLQKASEKVVQCGFRQIYKTDQKFHEEFKRDNTEWELHYKITEYPEGEKGVIIERYVSDIIETDRCVEMSGFEFNIPDDFHHCVVMLLHVARHLISGRGIGLRHLCDWAVFVENVDISAFGDQLREMGLWVFACSLSAVSHKYLGSREYQWLMNVDDDVLHSLIMEFVSHGNFGQKESNNTTQNLIINFSNPFKAWVSRTKRRFPFTKKYVFLMPIGMIMCAARFLYLRISGKSRWVTIEDVKTAEERRDVYTKLALYK